MKRTVRGSATALVTATVLLFTAACGTSNESPAASSGADSCEPLTQQQTVKVAEVPAVVYAPYFLAKSAGYFEDENLKIEGSTVRSSGEVVPAAARGQVDVVLASFSPTIFNAIASDVDLRYVAGAGVLTGEEPASGFFVRSDLVESGEINEVSDLMGRKVALTGGVGQGISFLAGLLLEEYGVSLADLDVVDVGLPEAVTALQNEAVDAAYVAAPMYQPLVEDGIAERFGDQSLLTGQRQAGLLMSPQMLNERRQVACAFTRAYIKANNELMQGDWRSDEEVLNQLVDAGFDEASILETPPYDYPVDLPMDSETDTIGKFQSMFAEFENVLSYEDPLSVDDIVDLELYDAALDSMK